MTSTTQSKNQAGARKHAHYFRSVAHLSEIDIYRMLDLFGVTDQALGHAIKKLVAPGGRGAGKDFRRDVQEAIDTLTRRLEMLDEDAAADAVVIPPPPEYDPDSVAFAGAVVDTTGWWIKWSGGTAPVGPSVVVECQRRGKIPRMGRASIFIWEHRGLPSDVIAYRVVPR
jgi:hypothetical protein